MQVRGLVSVGTICSHFGVLRLCARGAHPTPHTPFPMMRVFPMMRMLPMTRVLSMTPVFPCKSEIWFHKQLLLAASRRWLGAGLRGVVSGTPSHNPLVTPKPRSGPRNIGAEPRSLGAEPRNLGAEPETSEPSLETPEPSPQTLEPSPKTSEPSPNTSEPSPETSEPSPSLENSERPQNLGAEPRNLGAEPRPPEISEPSSETSKPNPTIPNDPWLTLWGDPVMRYEVFAGAGWKRGLASTFRGWLRDFCAEVENRVQRRGGRGGGKPPPWTRSNTLRPKGRRTLGSLWDHFGIILGYLWDHFGITLG